MTIVTLGLVIGFLTTVLSILVKVIGFPDQIRKNYKRKSTEGVSTTFYILSFLVYILWTAHGILAKDWVVIRSYCISDLRLPKEKIRNAST